MIRSVTVLAAALAASSAWGFTAQNGMSADQAGPSEIAVAFDGRRGDTDYWCAAGDFAQRVMGVEGGTRLWRASPKPRRAGQGILFTLDGRRAADGAGVSQFGKGPRDGSMPVSMATGSFCRVIWPFVD